MLEPVIVSAPFGNWLSFPGCTSTLGTFTLEYRGGLLYRLWRCLRTLRYHRRLRGWTNRLGLPNPGVDSVAYGDMRGKVVSVHGFTEREWYHLFVRLTVNRSCEALELNLSCPNVGHKPSVDELKSLPVWLSRLDHAVTVIAKLPPVLWMEYALPLWDMGVRCFHCCNTLPTPAGGLSGKTLMPFSLRAVEEIKQRWGDEVRVIGGGGISTPDDVAVYRKAGADHVAVASMLLNPFNWRKVKGLVEEMTCGRTNTSRLALLAASAATADAAAPSPDARPVSGV